MSSDYNYRLLQKDIKEGKQIVLFVGAGINFSQEHRMLWSDVIKNVIVLGKITGTRKGIPELSYPKMRTIMQECLLH